MSPSGGPPLALLLARREPCLRLIGEAADATSGREPADALNEMQGIVVQSNRHE
jgi:hypothetical protein